MGGPAVNTHIAWNFRGPTRGSCPNQQMKTKNAATKVGEIPKTPQGCPAAEAEHDVVNTQATHVAHDGLHMGGLGSWDTYGHFRLGGLVSKQQQPL